MSMSDWQPGTVVDRYTLTRQLGSGHQGQVWLAQAQWPTGRRQVAIKLTAKQDNLDHEANVTARLRHRDIVDVFDTGQVDGAAYLVMEYCDMGSLQAHEDLPLAALLDVGITVADAMAYAYRDLGLIHQDLKPANLLLHQGHVKVADLGIARMRGGGRKIRGGTHGFMAPEMTDRNVPITTRADIFSLGRVLRTLAGNDLPPVLVPIIERCEQTSPQARYPSMEHLANALRAIEPTGCNLTQFIGPAPSCARPDTHVWVGRTSQRLLLDQWAQTPGVLTVTGAPGVGKSALVRQAFRRSNLIRLWCNATDCHSLDDVQQRLGQLLATAAVIDDLAQTLSLRGPTVLVVDGLDGLDAADRVTLGERLSAGAPALRLVITVRGAEQADGLFVQPMGLADSAALLTQRAALRGVSLSANDPKVQELCRALSGLPLVIVMAASRIGVMTIDQVRKRLSGDFLRDVYGSLTDLVAEQLDSLPEQLQAPMAALGLFARAIDREVLQAATGCEPLVAEQVFDTAARLGWMEDQPQAVLLAPIRLALRSRPMPERQQMMASFASYLAATEMRDRFATADLRAACDWAIDQGELQTAAGCLTSIHRSTALASDLLWMKQTALTLMSHLNDAQKGPLACCLDVVRYYLGEPVQTRLPLLERIVEHAADNDGQLAAALADAYIDAGQTQRGRALLAHAVKTRPNPGLPLCMLASFHLICEQKVAEGLALLERSFSRFSHPSDRADIAGLWANALMLDAQWQQALDLCRAFPDDLTLRSHRSMALTMLGQLKQAEALIRADLERIRTSGSVDVFAQALDRLACVVMLRGGNAHPLVDELEQLGRPAYVASTVVARTRQYLFDGDLARAKALLNKPLPPCLDDDRVMDTQNRAMLALACGEPKQALALLQDVPTVGRFQITYNNALLAIAELHLQRPSAPLRLQRVRSTLGRWGCTPQAEIAQVVDGALASWAL